MNYGILLLKGVIRAWMLQLKDYNRCSIGNLLFRMSGISLVDVTSGNDTSMMLLHILVYFIEGLSKSNGKDAILVVVDRLSIAIS